MIFARYGIELGSITIHYFGLIIVAGLAIGSGLAAVDLRRRDESSAPLFGLLVRMLIGAVILGRLAYILNPPPSVAVLYDRAWYLSHFFDMQIGPLAVWNGGFDLAGMVLGAGLAFSWSAYRQGLDLRLWADALVRGLLLALVITPWANVVNEQMFGPPTTLGWGLKLSRRAAPFDDLLRYPDATRFHPIPIYLSLWAAVTLAAVTVIRHRWPDAFQRGKFFLLAMLITLSGIFVAGFWQLDVAVWVFGFSGVQILALAGWLVSLGLMLFPLVKSGTH